MAIRVDPRRLSTLKQLAAEADMRPGDLVRRWVEERIDAERGVAPAGGPTLAARLDEVVARIAALEAAAFPTVSTPAPEPVPSEPSLSIPDETETDEPAPADAGGGTAASGPSAKQRRAARRASARPTVRIALHDEMIAVIRERGQLTSSELATAIAERGRYTPPRSGKPLDAAMVSQRVSNPTYRSRFTRDNGRIGLAEVNGT